MNKAFFSVFSVFSVFSAKIWHTPIIKQNDLVNVEVDDSSVNSTSFFNIHVSQNYKMTKITGLIII